MSDTPRTNAAVIRDKMILSEVGLLEIVDAGASRQLERALAEMKDENFTLAAGQCVVDKGGLMGDEGGTPYCAMKLRAERAEAENAALREDAERYRWLREPQEFICVDQDLDGNFRSLIRKELDAAIDKARGGFGSRWAGGAS